MKWWTSKAWPRLRTWGAWLLGLVSVVFGAGWLWKTYKGRLGRVKDELAVVEATKEIAKLRAVREEIEDQVEVQDAAIEAIDQRIENNMRRVVAAHEGAEGLTDEEMLEEFRRLGI